jgi:hypothetical protein
MTKPRFLTLAGFIFLAAATRLIPHPYNFAPITAVALFGGAYFFDKRLAFLVPLSAMLLSDLLIGFHSQMQAVYASFAVIVCVGFWIQKQRTVSRIAGAAIASSILFFVVTNFGVWAFDSLYPKTIEGVAACYVAALPFFQNTLLGDMVYTTVMFGGFALAEKWMPALQEQPVS